MFHCGTYAVRIHDLLEIDANKLISAYVSVPEWVEEVLRTTPFVVVRRGPVTEQKVPIGVRGPHRNQRWGAYCHPELVKSVLTPPLLLKRTVPVSRANAMPALRALRGLKERWEDCEHPWGPGGSVGFELATGRHVVKPESDLDIVLYAESHVTTEEARSLCDRAMEMPALADIRVETPVCAFSLTEYARAEPKVILLRTPNRHVLGNNPWSDELKMDERGLGVRNRLSAPWA